MHTLTQALARIRRSVCTGLLAFFASAIGAVAQAAVLDGEYKLPSTLDASVASDVATELWAHVWRPDTPGRHPLVVFLHGNHGTCGFFDASRGIRVDDLTNYTFDGTCPPGYVVTSNHMGYAYLAKPLARAGYVVVSINANRGVTAADGVAGDDGLNLRRGRLVLRHLQQLAEWNQHGGEPASLGFSLQSQLDFDRIGLMGHSRGGEGVRAALAQYRDAYSPWPSRIGAMHVRAMFEIGPVDGQTSRVLNGTDVHWNVLLPGCDGDVSDLEGMQVFDRMLRIGSETVRNNKSTVLVYGANHNFYNTEWQESDATSCTRQKPLFPAVKGSASQRATALATLVPFFRAHLDPAGHADLATRFDPSHALPSDMARVATTYARGFTPATRAAETFVIDDFNRPSGTSSRHVDNFAVGLASYTHGIGDWAYADPRQRLAHVSWSDAAQSSLQLNAAPFANGVDVRTFGALEFRVLLNCQRSTCKGSSPPEGEVDFSIALVDAIDTVSSAVTLKSRAAVRRPVGTQWTGAIPQFQTVRISLADFPGVDLANFQGVRFSFDRGGAGSVSLANVRLTYGDAGSPEPPLSTTAPLAAPALPVDLALPARAGLAKRRPETNEVLALRRVTRGLPAGTDGVEIELKSTRRFPITDALPQLVVEGQTHALSRRISGARDRIAFTLPAAAFDALPTDSAMQLTIGGLEPWQFPRLNKAALR